jgi:uncharacterized protein YecE (DUF72 family)
VARACIGTAGWSLPRAVQSRFAGEGSHLEKYARVFNAVEINSTFHRPHRASTFERWAASVPRGFRFSVKLPRTITHDARLAGCGALLDEFLAGLAPLRSHLGCLLVQLPPSLPFDARATVAFFRAVRRRCDAAVALEPRHVSWFDAAADALLARERVARVAADPSRGPAGGVPGGWQGLRYFRLHGSPRVYYSSYDEAFLAQVAASVRAATSPCWVIFDNTTLGAGTANALRLAELLSKGKTPASPE